MLFLRKFSFAMQSLGRGPERAYVARQHQQKRKPQSSSECSRNEVQVQYPRALPRSLTQVVDWLVSVAWLSFPQESEIQTDSIRRLAAFERSAAAKDLAGKLSCPKDFP